MNKLWLCCLLMVGCSSAPLCEKKDIIYGGKIEATECSPQLDFYVRDKAIFDQDDCHYSVFYSDGECKTIQYLFVYCSMESVSYGQNAFYEMEFNYELYSYTWRSAIRVISGQKICNKSGSGSLYPY